LPLRLQSTPRAGGGSTFYVRQLDTMKRKKREPNAAAGNFAIAIGGSVTILTLFVAHDLGQKCRGMAAGLLGLSWGLKEVAAAKKWKQELEDKHYATTPEEIRESVQEEKMEKSGSMHNVLVLVGWIFLFLAVVGAVGVGYLFWMRR
jgi:hypothetical protein